MIKSEYLLFGLLLGVLVALSLPTVTIAITPYDWDWIDCHDHGWYKGHYNTSKNESDHCVCYNPEKWDGVDCALCTGDKSCAKGQKCLNHFDVNQHNYFNCKAQDPAKLFHINGSITAEFHFDDCVHGYASLNIFDKPTGAPLDFNCSIVDCVKSTDDSDQVKVTCSNIKCHCTTWCSTFVAAIIDNAIKGETTFSCVKSTGVCHVRTPPLLDALLVCEAAVCETPFVCGIPPIPKPLSAGWKALISIGSIVGGSAIVVATVFLIMFVCRKRTQIRNQHWATFDHTKVPATLSFTEVSCFVKTGLRGAKKQILHGVSGMARPGQITAIMGASGGGKTTLIDILAGRKSLGTVEGDILINGEKRKKSFKRISGYVLQDDIMMGTLTVREQVTYSAMLRLPSIMPNEEKLNRVDSILNELGISHIANSLIGTDMTRGISGGERKRVSIATELVTEPSILFLDEPTSGLDAYNASALMETLKKLALQHNTTVVLSIHQPRSDIFQQFDSLLVLSHGKTVFSGTPQDVVPYFAELGHVCPQNYNPADFIIDTITLHPNLVDDDIKMANGSQGKTRIYRWPKDKNGQIQGGSDDGEIDEDEEIPKHHMDERTKKYMKKEFASSFWTQLNILCQRTFKNILRNPYLLRAQYILTCCLSVLVGLIFKDLSYDLYGVQGRAGCLFFLLCLLSFSCMSSLDTFFHERALFVRERAQGSYRTSSYFLSKTICDILPMRVVPPIILGTVCYWMMTHPQTQPEWVHYLWCIVVLVLVSVVACTMCLFISCSCPSMAVSNLVAILVLLFFMLFGGLLANKTTIPPFINWFRWLSFINYGYEILMVNELQGTTINFNPPHVDPIPVTGEEFLEQFDMDINRWQMDTGVLVAMAGGYLILSYIFLRFHIKERR